MLKFASVLLYQQPLQLPPYERPLSNFTAIRPPLFGISVDFTRAVVLHPVEINQPPE